MSPGYAWRCRIGRRNCASSNAKHASAVQIGHRMLRVHRRIEKLEQAFNVSDRIPRFEMMISFVEPGGLVTRRLLIAKGKQEWIDGPVPEENRKEAE
jgi:hypothetical protein